MAKDDKDKKKAGRKATEAGSRPATGAHHPAKAHGQPTVVDASLPGTRAELVARHAEVRRRRNAAAHGSDEHRAAIDEIGRIEIRIAAIERAMTPPKG